MRCDFDALSRFVDGELPPERMRVVMRHVNSCASCSDELARLRHINHVLWNWGAKREPVPPPTQERIRRSVERRRRLGPFIALSRMTPAAVGSMIAALFVDMTANLAPIYQSASQSPTPQSTGRESAHVIKQQMQPLLYQRGKSAVVSSQASTTRASLMDRHRQLDMY